MPNLLLYGWAIFKLATLVSNDPSLIENFTVLSTLSLLVWATLEITTGASYFRKLLGLAIFVAIVT